MQNFELELCCTCEDTSPSQFCSNWTSVITSVTGSTVLKVSEQLPYHSLTRWLRWNLGCCSVHIGVLVHSFSSHLFHVEILKVVQTSLQWDISSTTNQTISVRYEYLRHFVWVPSQWDILSTITDVAIVG